MNRRGFLARLCALLASVPLLRRGAAASAPSTSVDTALLARHAARLREQVEAHEPEHSRERLPGWNVQGRRGWYPSVSEALRDADEGTFIFVHPAEVGPGIGEARWDFDGRCLLTGTMDGDALVVTHAPAATPPRDGGC